MSGDAFGEDYFGTGPNDRVGEDHRMHSRRHLQPCNHAAGGGSLTGA